jgi:RNA polymerase sigma-70 factor (ECF subfamily)
MSDSADGSRDEVLVVAAILGDLDAFDILARRYRAAAVRTAQAIVGREFAEDVAQEALLIAFKALPSIEEPGRFGAWLGVITRHHALRFGKREKARWAGHVELDDVLLARVGALTLPLVPSCDGDEELSLALESVPGDYALALRLRYMDEMPLKRISAFLGVPVSTVKWRIHHGKALLKEKVQLLRERGKTWKEIQK